MGRRFFIITLLILLLFTACIKRECRKKEDSVSGDAIEIVIAKYNDFIFPAIPDSFYLIHHHENGFSGYTINFVILNDVELGLVNNVFSQHGFTIPSIDFTKHSYYIFQDTNFDKNHKININLQLNNSDSISNILDITEYPDKFQIGLETLTDGRFIVIKTNKINFRKYEKQNYSKYCS